MSDRSSAPFSPVLSRRRAAWYSQRGGTAAAAAEAEGGGNGAEQAAANDLAQQLEAGEPAAAATRDPAVVVSGLDAGSGEGQGAPPLAAAAAARPAPGDWRHPQGVPERVAAADEAAAQLAAHDAELGSATWAPTRQLAPTGSLHSTGLAILNAGAAGDVGSAAATGGATAAAPAAPTGGGFSFGGVGSAKPKLGVKKAGGFAIGKKKKARTGNVFGAAAVEEVVEEMPAEARALMQVRSCCLLLAACCFPKVGLALTRNNLLRYRTRAPRRRAPAARARASTCTGEGKNAASNLPQVLILVTFLERVRPFFQGRDKARVSFITK